MNIGLIGSGGREHALCKKIFESKSKKKIICFPGNAGTSKIAINVNVNLLDFKKIFSYIVFYKIELVIIGPEEPLVRGLADYLRKRNIKVFGPSKYSAKLEGSKAFVKKLCKLNKIPTANFKVCNTKTDVNNFLKTNELPIVVKADGLAAGKGVSICKKKQDVIKISNEIFNGKFQSSKKLILEEFLSGEELSYFLIVDKNGYKFFGSAQDHKKVGLKDTGPNTGGMGAYSPAPILNKKLEKKIIKKIINPTLLALKRKKRPFTGFLYAGLMIQNNEPYLIEYNVRMGDPECQVILPRLKTDLVQLLKNATNNKLKNTVIKWSKEKCMTIVLCSKGYPKDYKKNIIIKNLDQVKLGKKDTIFHAGTRFENNNFYSNGGRVLNITSIGNNFLKIRENIINVIKKIKWDGGFFRKDIGWRVIDK